METLLKKDRIEEVNPYLFQKIHSKINYESSYSIPVWSMNILKLSIFALVLLMGFNIHSTINSKSDSNQISESNSYTEFIEDYHFEALSSLYPVELLSEKVEDE